VTAPSGRSIHIDPYERQWIRGAIILLAVFAALVVAASVVFGFGLTTGHDRVDPATVTDSGPFATPGVRQVEPGVYEAHIVARTFSFDPATITVPVGAEVTFYVTSVDVGHGFIIANTNVNMQVVPGHVSVLSTTFDRAGEYDYICSEFCGIGHHRMFGTLVVEE
jgi:cytochrome c oxidase subunit 2